MKENKKYYYNVTMGFPAILIITLLVLIYGIWDLPTSEGLLYILSWLVIIVFSILVFFTLVVLVQSYRKIGYIELKGEELTLNNLFNVSKTANLSDKYRCHKRKGSIRYITFYDEDKKVKLMVGDGFELDLIEIEKLLQQKNDTTK